MELTKTQALVISMILVIAAAVVVPGCTSPADKGLRDFWEQLTRQAN